MPQFTPNGGVATPSLIAALLKDQGPWADAVLGQSYGMPAPIRKAFLSGAAKWQIPNEKTLIITMVESPSPPKPNGSGTSSQST